MDEKKLRKAMRARTTCKLELVNLIDINYPNWSQTKLIIEYVLFEILI